jgi:hypothetical protein
VRRSGDAVEFSDPCPWEQCELDTIREVPQIHWRANGDDPPEEIHREEDVGGLISSRSATTRTTRLLRWVRRTLIVVLSILVILRAKTAPSSVGSQQFLAWVVAGSVVLVLLVVTTYRDIARRFDCGPRDI